jgi:hypothetical protein
MNRLQTAAVGLAPPIGAITIAEINTVLGCASLILGMSFTIWNWRRIAKQPPATK